LAEKPSTKEVFFDPKIRKAAWVGCTISIFQQLTGINAIIFYSSSIFAASGSSMSANVQTTLVMGINMVSVIGAFFMLTKYGRRELEIFWTGACAVCLVIQGIASIQNWNTLMLIMTMLFVAAFEFGPGPILWLYNGEILEENAISVAVFLNWLFVMIIGLLTPSLMESWLGSGPTFIMFGLFNIAGVAFLYFFMKETKGLTDAEVKRLYQEKEYDGPIK
jgi:hypothetical protein